MIDQIETGHSISIGQFNLCPLAQMDEVSIQEKAIYQLLLLNITKNSSIQSMLPLPGSKSAAAVCQTLPQSATSFHFGEIFFFQSQR